jgi:hypothetical protein
MGELNMLQKQYQVFFAFLLFLSSCTVALPGSSSSGSGITGSVPIFQGMTVGALSNSNNLQSPKSQGEINQDNPFGLPNNEMIEHRIESDLANLLEEETMDYYALPSEVVRITINILNPQSYVIFSFNLNGRRYQSFEFREGSTSTRLLMDVSLQNSPGIQSLTIDEIKYIVDSGGDNQIRDVVMFGDQTVEVGIGYNQLPIVNMVSQTILPTTVNYEIEVTDSLNMLSTQETAIYFYFFDGETLQKEVLIVGNNELEFNKLTSKTLYQYALVSALNPLDGEGPVLTYHNQEAFLTSNFIQLSVNSTKESISYEVSVMNGLESGVINRVEIEKNSEIINTQANSIGSFVELLSNNEYALNVYYDYSHEGETELFTEVYSLTASTLAKLTPTFSFTDVVAGKEDVTFEYEVTDLDEVGVLSKIELLKGEEVVETLTEFEDTSFANLLSNNDYQLKATYTYDLNDGVGEQSIVITNQTKTHPKEVPNIDILIKDVQSNLINIELDIQDEDQTIISYTLEFYDNNQNLINTFTNESSIIFNNLNSYSNYTFDLTYIYSLDETIEYQPLSVTIDREVKTLALPIQVTGVDYITSNTIQTKGEVLVRIYLLNPSSVNLISVITNLGFFEINKNLSNSNSVVIKYQDDSIGGRFNILIEGFSYLDNQNELEINSVSEIYFEIKVLGTIDLIDLMVISDNQYVNVVSAESNSFVKILLINPSEYDIFSIILQQSSIETIYDEDFTLSEDKQIITLPWGGDRNIETNESSYNLNYLVLRGLSYGFDEQSKSDLTFDLSVLPLKVRYIKIVSSLVPLPITNYSELISMNTYGSYYLANDIDISNFNHTTPITFYGFFDGRGHKIKNLNILSISSTVDWREIYVGLFGDLRGYVLNLEIENSTIYLDYKRPIRFGLLTGYLSKGLIQNIKVTGSNSIYVASSQEIEYGNLVGAVGGNGSILSSEFNGQLNAQLKAAPLSEGSGPVVGGIVGKTSAAGSIFGNKLFGTLNYEFDITPQSNRYISGYRFGGIAGRENSGYYSFNYVEAAINLIDKNPVTSQTIYVAGIIGTINNKHTHNVFNGNINISTSGYLNVGGFTTGGTLSFVKNFIFGGTITISNARRDSYGHIVSYIDSYNRAFNNNYVMEGSSISNSGNIVAIDSVVSPLINYLNKPNEFELPIFSIGSFSQENGLIINHVATFRVYEIIKVIELINTIDTNSDEAYIQSIIDLFNQLEVNEKTLVYNQSEIN